LRSLLNVLIYKSGNTAPHQQQTTDPRGDIMADNKTQDYWKDDKDGHVDTRERNFECENKDEHLGCDPGVDVAG
jgi:hypothetical protein